MSDRVYFSDELIAPISAQNPAGRNLRDEPIFRQILDARRSDDQLNAGDWKTLEGPKVAEWDRVADICLEALKADSKDLRLACFLTEAAIHLDGFHGLRDCVRLTKELLYRFWDLGLFPAIEDGDLDYRASSLTWFNDRMPEAMHWVPMTARIGENYNFIRYLQALQIGTEDAIQGASGEKRDTIAGLRRQGWISLDAFDGAIKATKRKDFEGICNAFDEAYEQFRALRKVVEERFGEEAPSLATASDAFDEMRGVFRRALKMKRDQEPDPQPENKPDDATAQPAPTMVGFWTAGMPTDQSGSWQQAEAVVRDGDVDQGLKRMAALAAQETSGRAQFLRKLMLVDVCRNTGRERLARTVLEELNKQIGDYKLDRWESSALVGAVWSRLYQFYKKSEMSSEQEQAVVLYNQLCRLDPWQAYLDCED
jgi:type VI secretion system protein ImpA